MFHPCFSSTFKKCTPPQPSSTFLYLLRGTDCLLQDPCGDSLPARIALKNLYPRAYLHCRIYPRLSVKGPLPPHSAHTPPSSLMVNCSWATHQLPQMSLNGGVASTAAVMQPLLCIALCCKSHGASLQPSQWCSSLSCKRFPDSAEWGTLIFPLFHVNVPWTRWCEAFSKNDLDRNIELKCLFFSLLKTLPALEVTESCQMQPGPGVRNKPNPSEEAVDIFMYFDAIFEGFSLFFFFFLRTCCFLHHWRFLSFFHYAF